MPLLSLEQLMKQQEQHIILKNITLTVNRQERLGLKMNQLEANTFFDLVEKKQEASSGLIVFQGQTILSDRREDQLYPTLTVKQYLSSFQKIAPQRTLELTALLEAFSLADIANERIKKLSYSQKKRISLARIYLFQPDLILLHSPLSDLSNEGIELYLRSLAAFNDHGTGMIFTSNYTEDLLLLSDKIYHYQPATGLVPTDLINPQDEVDTATPQETNLHVPDIFKVSCKVADKTIFFDPIEIDFIESINSISMISVSGEKFPTTLTMSQLEEKLKAFGFFRCHRSYLVNLQRIAELISYSRNSFTLILKGAEQAKIPLSRSRLDEFKELLDF